jgi:hypothetical protein
MTTYTFERIIALFILASAMLTSWVLYMYAMIALGGPTTLVIEGKDLGAGHEDRQTSRRRDRYANQPIYISHRIDPPFLEAVSVAIQFDRDPKQGQPSECKIHMIKPADKRSPKRYRSEKYKIKLVSVLSSIVYDLSPPLDHLRIAVYKEDGKVVIYTKGDGGAGGTVEMYRGQSPILELKR